MEKRRHARIDFRKDAKLTVLPAGPSFKVHTLNLSISGAGIFSSLTLEPGQAIRLSVCLSDSKKANHSESITGNIVHAWLNPASVDPNGRVLGILFDEFVSHNNCPGLWRVLQEGLKKA